VRLTEYEHPPISPREMMARIRERVYSSDWEIPDDKYAEMLAQLDEWFAQSIVHPDTPAATTGVFSALTATWP
jgi:hypothetical protein